MFLNCREKRCPMPAPAIACVHIPRFAVEVERQRRKDAGTRLILIGEGTVFAYSLGADASGVRSGVRMSEAIGLCPRAVVLPQDGSDYPKPLAQGIDMRG